MSEEWDVSLVSGAACAAALRSLGHEMIEIDVDEDLLSNLISIKPDVVFNALHGKWGEDGRVQGILEWLRIPYTHSGVLASALAMDKQRAKIIFKNAGIPVAESLLVKRKDIGVGHVIAPPYVIKPNNEGSSIGVYLIKDAYEYPPVLDDSMPETIMVESYVPGRELTCAVLGDKVLAITDIVTDRWYDYEQNMVRMGRVMSFLRIYLLMSVS